MRYYDMRHNGVRQSGMRQNTIPPSSYRVSINTDQNILFCNKNNNRHCNLGADNYTCVLAQIFDTHISRI